MQRFIDHLHESFFPQRVFVIPGFRRICRHPTDGRFGGSHCPVILQFKDPARHVELDVLAVGVLELESLCGSLVGILEERVQATQQARIYRDGANIGLLRRGDEQSLPCEGSRVRETVSSTGFQWKRAECVDVRKSRPSSPFVGSKVSFMGAIFSWSASYVVDSRRW